MRTFFYTIKQAFLQFGRNFNMGLASIFAITAMLLILSVFFIAALNVNMAAEAIKGDYDTIEIYLKDDVKKKQAQKLVADLKETDGVADAWYKSKKKAMKESMALERKAAEAEIAAARISARMEGRAQAAAARQNKQLAKKAAKNDLKALKYERKLAKKIRRAQKRAGTA